MLYCCMLYRALYCIALFCCMAMQCARDTTIHQHTAYSTIQPPQCECECVCGCEREREYECVSVNMNGSRCGVGVWWGVEHAWCAWLVV